MTERWRAPVAALAAPERLHLYGDIIARTAEGKALQRAELSSRQLRALEALAKVGLVLEENGALVPDQRLFPELLAEAGAPVVDRTVTRFLVDGRIRAYPRRKGDRRRLLEHVADSVLSPGAALTEREVTELLRRFTDDPATLRRYLVDEGIITRDAAGAEYRLSGVG